MPQIRERGRAHEALNRGGPSVCREGTSAWDPLGVGTLFKTHGTYKRVTAEEVLTQGSPNPLTPPANTSGHRASGLQVPWRPARPHCSGSCLKHLERRILWHCARDPCCGAVPQGVAPGSSPPPVCAHSASPSRGAPGCGFQIGPAHERPTTGPQGDQGGPGVQMSSTTAPSLGPPTCSGGCRCPRSGAEPRGCRGSPASLFDLWALMPSPPCSGQKGAEPHLGLAWKNEDKTPRRCCVSGFLALTGARRPPWRSKPAPSCVAGMSHAWQLRTWPVHAEVC